MNIVSQWWGTLRFHDKMVAILVAGVITVVTSQAWIIRVNRSKLDQLNAQIANMQVQQRLDDLQKKILEVDVQLAETKATIVTIDGRLASTEKKLKAPWKPRGLTSHEIAEAFRTLDP